MAENMRVEQDDDFYWTAGTEYLQVVVDHLNNTLKENHIASALQRKKICKMFAFGFGNFLDQYWMETEGKKRYPLLCFTNEFLDIDVPVEEVEPLYFPVRDFEFHGAAGEVVDEYFDTQKEHLNLVIGTVGGEEEEDEEDVEEDEEDED